MAFPSSTALGLVGIVGLVAASAFFSSSETAIFTLPAGWFDEAGGEEDRRATALRSLRADPHRLLVTILVGNNVVNVAISSVTTVLVLDYLGPGSAVTVATVAASFVVLVFGEIVPKSYGLGHARPWALTVARPLAAVELALYPLVAFFTVVTRQVSRAVGGDAAIEEPYLAD
ncbi:MAG: CNNM domain-containing protein [Halobacteriales archaeon]